MVGDTLRLPIAAVTGELGASIAISLVSSPQPFTLRITTARRHTFRGYYARPPGGDIFTDTLLARKRDGRVLTRSGWSLRPNVQNYFYFTVTLNLAHLPSLIGVGDDPTRTSLVLATVRAFGYVNDVLLRAAYRRHYPPHVSWRPARQLTIAYMRDPYGDIPRPPTDNACP